ncbi:hypothetical protein Glove_707g64 [Diversispora epigaea]|uniref:Uncharacterized protein n=1 Tax=Diversispora epigaea TaxID=1348612 RepID=A0A397G5S8_9GLOM|nr:hypothetical protein Glove_707g64 [Diversispora epigaea]
MENHRSAMEPIDIEPSSIIYDKWFQKMYLTISNLITEGNIALLNKADSNDPGLNHVEENERKRLKNSSGFKQNGRSTVKQKRPYPNEIEMDWLKYSVCFDMKRVLFGSKFTYKWLADRTGIPS